MERERKNERLRENCLTKTNVVLLFQKGIWIWGTPIKGYSPEGEPVNLLIMDSEGIGSTDEDQTHDTRVFSLAILLASNFIYNSMGSIDVIC